jgi:citrate synthase (EC 2.3.3.1)
MSDTLNPGLEGVLLDESALSYIDGDAGTLLYRGYRIEELARETSFEEVTHLLWEGQLPDAAALASFRSTLASQRAIDASVDAVIETLVAAEETPMAALRTLISMLSAYDAVEADDDLARLRETACHVTAQLPTLLAAYHRRREGLSPVDPDPELSHAANFLYMLSGERPDPVIAETFDMALVLHADHGLNASTFSAMVTASTMADLHAAVTAAVGTLSGSWHGGANAAVMQMLREVDASGTPPTEWVADALAAGRRIPGFGHRVYTVTDPRATILGEASEALAEAAGDPRWIEYSEAIETYMREEKDLVPNVDFYSASMYHQMGIPTDLYTPIFALSRVVGWAAHIVEQRTDNRLIRPRARYVGPAERPVPPIAER